MSTRKPTVLRLFNWNGGPIEELFTPCPAPLRRFQPGFIFYIKSFLIYVFLAFHTVRYDCLTENYSVALPSGMETFSCEFKTYKS